MKRITLGALDYGLAFGVDRTLRDLLLRGRLSAVGCMVGTDLWSREFLPMKEVAEELGERGLVGLTLTLSGDRAKPVSPRMAQVYGDVLPTRGAWERRAFFRMLPEEILKAEVSAQIEAYVSKMERPPDFISLREGLMDRSAIAKLVIKTIATAGLSRLPYLVTSLPPGLQAGRVRSMAKKNGIEVLPWGPPLPETEDREQLHTRLRRHFDGLTDMTFVAGVPGAADDRLRRDESREKIAIRECHREVLGSGRFFRTLDEKDVFLN
ncbi:ChbG/HpnK family deacetylase [Roseibium sp.]|uniref:ChbG/HpnK family deacetylase n=1 Tax=Roseibium sp. TaxID=1936156 RepID=UPI003A97E202